MDYFCRADKKFKISQSRSWTQLFGAAYPLSEVLYKTSAVSIFLCFCWTYASPHGAFRHGWTKSMISAICKVQLDGRLMSFFSCEV